MSLHKATAAFSPIPLLDISISLKLVFFKIIGYQQIANNYSFFRGFLVKMVISPMNLVNMVVGGVQYKIYERLKEKLNFDSPKNIFYKW